MKMLLAAAVLCFAGCSRDGVQDSFPDGGSQDGAKQYLAFALSSTDATTLGVPSLKVDDDASNPYEGDFNPGRADEQAISEDVEAHAVLLFDENDGFYGNAELSTTANRSVYLAAFEPKKTNLPSKLLVVVNARPWRLDNLLEQLSDASAYPAGFTALQTAMQWLTLENSAYGSQEAAGESPAFYEAADGTVYFTMTSSVYGGSGDSIVAASPYGGETLANYVFTKPEEALASPLTLYVERLVAKFTVGFLDEYGKESFLSGNDPVFIIPGSDNSFQYINDWKADIDESEEEEYRVHSGRWKVHIVSWDINALEPNTFLFKNLSNVPGGSLADNSFSSVSWWNTANPTDRPRSYWAVDQHYAGGTVSPFGGANRTANSYPQQFRIAYDAEEPLASYEIDETQQHATDGSWYDPTAWALDYLSFNDIRTRSVSKYALENTFDPAPLADALAADGHLRVGSHILLATQLVIEGYDEGYDGGELDEQNLLQGVRTKYYNGAEFMAEPAMLKWSVYSLGTQLTDKAREIKLLNDANGLTVSLTSVDSKLYADAACETEISGDTVLDYFEIVPAQIVGGDGWATIGLKAGCEIWIKDAKENPTNITDYLPSMIYGLLEPVRAFTGGRMYYAIPVLHERQFAAGKFDASSLQVGDVGVVRNHWYRVKVGSISGLGTSVHNPDQPIIPNHEPEFRSLGVQLEILPWSVLKLDDVIL